MDVTENLTMTETGADGPSAGPGRKRDHTRDDAILTATLDVLTDVGYENLTMDLVAARARAGKATLYRRWSSKGELIVEAVRRMKVTDVDLANPPDTGAVRGDFLALFQPQSFEEIERTLAIMAGLSSMLAGNASIAGAAHTAVVRPWADAHQIIIQRGIARGEISPLVDVETISMVTPTLAAYRSIVQRLPFDFEFLTSIVDGVLLPALGLSAGDSRSRSSAQEG